MTRTIILLLVLISNSYSYGQTAIVSTEKTEYKTNEEIEIQYEINQIVDSVSYLKEQGFYVIDKPTKSLSSTKNTQYTGTASEIKTIVSEYSSTYRYKIIAIQPGELKILSPTFYINGIGITADSIKLKITGKALNADELENLKLNIFICSSVIPDGTIKITYSDKYGFIEKYYDSKWHIERKLTNKEIKKYKKLEKIIHLND